MNLFILDTDPIISAKMNCDKHVCKIILEAIQMMSLAHYHCGSRDDHLWYSMTHYNNHVSKWVRETAANYNWTAMHGLTLCREYTLRYGKIHKSHGLMLWLADNVPKIPIGALTPFRQAVAEDCYHADPVIAYHHYYVIYKRRFAKWRLGNIPLWFIRLCELNRHQILPDLSNLNTDMVLTY